MATKKTASTTAASKKTTGRKTDEARENGTAEATASKAAAKKSVAAPKVAGGDSAAPRGTSSDRAGKTAPTHAEIARLAHRFWEERGRHHGSHVADWIRAEQELSGRSRS